MSEGCSIIIAFFGGRGGGEATAKSAKKMRPRICLKYIQRILTLFALQNEISPQTNFTAKRRRKIYRNYSAPSSTAGRGRKVRCIVCSRRREKGGSGEMRWGRQKSNLASSFSSSSSSKTAAAISGWLRCQREIREGEGRALPTPSFPPPSHPTTSLRSSCMDASVCVHAPKLRAAHSPSPSYMALKTPRPSSLPTYISSPSFSDFSDAARSRR